MTTPGEQQLLDALTELDEAVKALPVSNPKPSLLPHFARIGELASQLPPTADPELRHFLERKSYQKARWLLEGRG
jgi:hypothetical protein